MAMDAERWERMQVLFHAAVDLAPDQQRRYLEAECVDDPSLVSSTLALLAEDSRADSLLDRGLATVAHELVGRDAAYVPSSGRFGPYRVIKLLGEGGMGVVYLAEREDLGSLAAIKILRDAWLSPSRRERFASEQRTLAQLNHPQIARLFDANTLPDGTPWFVMEYVEGVPLTDYCRANGSSIAERLRLFRDVCEGVQHAHRNLVVHRDLKPSNILVAADGRVKLVDFGIAKQLESLEMPVDQTRTGLRLMTPAYAAPEQFAGGAAGIHTDVYSLGVILYELAVGRLPFDFTNRAPSEIAAIVAEHEPERPSAAARRMAFLSDANAHVRTANAAQWSDLDVLCLTAMHKDPQRRYLTVDALVRDVDHYMRGEPLDARPDSVRYRAAKFVRRNWREVTAGSAVLLMVIALVVFYTIRLTGARNEAIAETARAQRIQRFTLDLFEGGDRDAGPADSLRVMTLLERGLREARSLDAEPVVQAELYGTLGGIYQKMGNLVRADSLLHTALERREAAVGAAHPDAAEGRIALGLLRIDQARFEEAERFIREGLTTLRRTLPATHPSVARANVALGRVLQERGEYAAAVPLLEDAARAYSAAPGATRDLASSLSSLADVHYYAGHYDVADSLNRRVHSMYRQLYGERHPLVAEILMNLGATQFDRGSYVEAERFDREALAITRAFYGDEHHQTAATLTHLGRALSFQKRYAEADSVLKRALAIRERVYGPVHPSVASTVNEIGSIALAQDRYADAEVAFKRMLEIYHSIYGDKHYLLGIATSNLASVYNNEKDYPRAERMFREAVRRFTEAQGPDHLNTGIARIKLGRSLLRQRRFAEAVVETQAGYEILSKQASPALGFLINARKDLVAEYDTLGQPEKADRYRRELADTAKK
jgi:serine/threonine-protein kinase